MDYSSKLTARNIIDYLESNQFEQVEEIKQKLHEDLFNTNKDAWPVNGFFDYFLTSGSLRAIEILLSVKDPHDRHLFDRLADTLRGSNKLKALEFLGYLAKREPPWLYKIQQHSLLKELLKILKNDTDEVVLVNAALVLAAILPVIPATVPKLFDDIFTIFKLTVWHTVRSSSSQMFLIHLRLAIAALFHRLYGMYPVNFLSYMRTHIGLKDATLAFQSSLKVKCKPLLETVKMNPLLVTETRESEIQESRWKSLDTNDILAECYHLVLSVNPFREEEVHEFWREGEDNVLDIPELPEQTDPEGIVCENLRTIMNDSSQWISLANNIYEAIYSAGSGIPTTPIPITGLGRVSTPLEKSAFQQKFPVAEQAIEATPENTPYTTPVKELEVRLKAVPMNPQVWRLGGRQAAHKIALGETQCLPEKLVDDYGQMDRRGSLLAHKLDVLTKERRGSCEEVKVFRDDVISAKDDGRSIVERKNIVLSPLKIEPRVDIKGLSSPVEFTDANFSKSKKPLPSVKPSICPSDVVTQEDREVSAVLSPSKTTTPEKTAEGERVQDSSGEESNDKESDDSDQKEEIVAKRFLEEIADEDTLSFVAGGSFPETKREFPKRRLRYHSHCFTGSTSMGEPGIKKQKSFSSPSINQDAVKLIPQPGLNDSISTIAVSDSPTKTYETKECQTEPESELPVNHLLPFLFPVVCDESTHLSASAPLSPPSRYSFSYPTAEESLEKYMEYASEYHKKSADFFTSRVATDEWDDPSLLRSHVNLLHVRLLFERRMKMMASEKARKLANQLRRSRAVEEQNRQGEIHLREALSATKVLKFELETARKQKISVENQMAELKVAHESQIKHFHQLLKESQNQLESSKNHIQKLFEENRRLKQDYDRICGQKVDLENSYRFLKNESDTASALRQEMLEMKHRFLILGEVNQRLGTELQNLSSTSGTDSHQMDLFKEASKQEISEIRFACEEAMREKDAAMARIGDLESDINEKLLVIQEIKEHLREANYLHAQQLKEKQHRYEELVAQNYQLEGDRFHLQQLIEKLKQDKKDRYCIPIAGRRPDMDVGQSPASTGSSFSNASISGATGSPSELSVSLGMEVSEGFTESQFMNLENFLKKQDGH
ncbi:uncharacterized protein LOC136037141 isoform X2 [Artemia franciscana]|uniref:uncharacterized protein LOC136037141 isoform X2 n=1 Tax=Artemia franciscana TaxID=6661 RepID=UPI0032DBED2E